LSFESSQSHKDPAWNPPSPDPDPIDEGTSLQDRLEAETEAVLDQADRGWGIGVVLPKWWGLSDVTERVAGSILLMLILGSGITQLLWAQDSGIGAKLLTYMRVFGGTLLALWCLQTLIQRRVYGRRRPRAERKSAARERVLKKWQ
jgi:hypothetical protein